MTSILFVCHGNICRSPTAEFVMKEIVRSGGREKDFRIASAAVSTEALGCGIYPPAAACLTRHGIPFDDRKARQMTAADYSEYDLLIGMDESNRARMRRICSGDPEGKIYLLTDFSGTGRPVADPWYTGDFETAFQDIRSGCLAIYQKYSR